MTQSMIREFRDDHYFLSNFYEREMTYLSRYVAATGEHLFQMLKTTDEAERRNVLSAPTPNAAKFAGRRVTMRPDWDQIRLTAMQEVLTSKFSHPDLAAKLVATGDAELIEGNYWNDTFWGVNLRTGDGQNWLGRLLMLQRAQLIAGNSAVDPL